jgi:hypothetical protein
MPIMTLTPVQGHTSARPHAVHEALRRFGPLPAARVERAGRARNRICTRRSGGGAIDRITVRCALRARDQSLEERNAVIRRTVPDAGNLQLRRRFYRRLAATRAGHKVDADIIVQ